jgi:hypothetical protein
VLYQLSYVGLASLIVDRDSLFDIP